MPATLALSLQGAQVSQERYMVFIVVLGVCLTIALAFFLFRDRWFGWLRDRPRR